LQLYLLIKNDQIMPTEIVTTQDLAEFKKEILELLQQTKSAKEATGKTPAKQYLKSYEVKKMLNISHGTIQTLRDNGTLPHYRVGSMILYDFDDIMALMKESRVKKNSAL